MRLETSPRAAVIVCTRERPRELERCLAAVGRLDPKPHETLVVDNAPETSATRELAARFPVRYLLEPRAGLSRARNQGASSCEADVVCYTDDDAVPESDWLEHLLAPFRDDRVAAVLGRVLPLSLATEGERAWEDLLAGAGRVSPGSVGRDDPHWFELANFGVLGDGNNLAVRRSVFARWRGFDPRLGRGARMSGGEEHYALFQLLKLGHRVACAPRAVVRHPHPETLEAVRARRRRHVEEVAAYLAFLVSQEPWCAPRVLREAIHAVLGTPRPWHVGRRRRGETGERPELARGVLAGLGRFLLSGVDGGRRVS